jgi:hypothetical protein
MHLRYNRSKEIDQLYYSKECNDMLPPGYHEQACRLFCRILHRLEEMERQNGKDDTTSTTGTGREKNTET